MAPPDDILLLNLTRMGDLVQSTPVAVGLKRQFPEARIVVCAQERFLSSARLMDGVDEIIPVEYDELRKISSSQTAPLSEMVAEAKALLRPLLSRRFRRAVNLTHSRTSAYLMYLLDAEEKFGGQMEGTGHREIRQPWMLFLHNFGMNKHLTPFNLVDIYALGGGVPIHREPVSLSIRVPAEAEEWAERYLADNAPGAGPLIAIQSTASDAHKMWHPSSFIRTCRILSDTVRARFLFIGSKEEKELVEKIHHAVDAPGSAVAAGGTDLPQLCALLRRADLMITNDTGPMHLAAAVGTPVLALAIGPVYYSNTSPYGEGHLVFQPAASCAPCSFLVRCVNPECKSMVSPEAVASLALRRLGGEPLVPGGVADSPEFSGCEVYLSGRGEDGLMDYLPLLRRPRTFRWTLERGYRKLWGDVLLRGVPPPGGDRRVASGGNGVFHALRGLESLAGRGGNAASDIWKAARAPSGHIDLLQDRMGIIRATSDGVREQGKACPEINSLCEMFSLEEANMPEGDLAESARQNVVLFENLLRRCRSLSYLLTNGIRGGDPGAGGIGCG